MTWTITPGSMGAVLIAIDLFGIDRVSPGTWGTPVFVRDLTLEEETVGAELLQSIGLRLTRDGNSESA